MALCAMLLAMVPFCAQAQVPSPPPAPIAPAGVFRAAPPKVPYAAAQSFANSQAYAAGVPYGVPPAYAAPQQGMPAAQQIVPVNYQGEAFAAPPLPLATQPGRAPASDAPPPAFAPTGAYLAAPPKVPFSGVTTFGMPPVFPTLRANYDDPGAAPLPGELGGAFGPGLAMSRNMPQAEAPAGMFQPAPPRVPFTPLPMPRPPQPEMSVIEDTGEPEPTNWFTRVVGDPVLMIPTTVYFRGEVLLLRREGVGAFTPMILDFNANTVTDTSVFNFPLDAAFRGTVGLGFAMNRALEFTYTSVSNWSSSFSQGGDNALFFPGSPDPTIPSDLSLVSSDYNAAELMTATYTSRFKSMELNYFHNTRYQRIDLLAGLRYVELVDNLDINSFNVDTGTASDFNVLNTNYMTGGQLGGRVRLDIDLFRIEFIGKCAAFNNYVASNTVVGDQGNTVLLRNATANGSNASYLFELGLNGIYRYGPHLLFRGGYNAYWINQVSLAPAYLDFSIDPNAGTMASHAGNILLHGANIGAEYQF